MLYQKIDGQRLYSVGAAWLKILNHHSEDVVKSRIALVEKHANNDPILFEIFKVLLADGVYKTYSYTEASMLKPRVELLRQEWLFNRARENQTLKNKRK
jgi:hypothetical protein